MNENVIAKEVVDAAVKVHRELGPGLLETVYEVVLARELERRGLRVERQVPVPIVYGGMRFEEGFRAVRPKDMSSHRVWTLVLAIMVLCAVAHGYPKKHAPFEKGEAPASVQLTDCTIVKTQCLAGDMADYPSVLYFVAPHDSKRTTLKMERLIATDSCGWRITVLDAQGKPISTPATNDMPSYVYRVKSGDLNHDGQTDFLVNIWTGGCGLAAEGSTTTFLLSSGARYVATDFYSFDFGPEDIVNFRKDGPCYFILSDLIENGKEKTKDGREHNFWVYRLYQFRGSEMVEANGDDRRFPKWVWYTHKENHRETDQLTRAQKERLLNPPGAQPGDRASQSRPVR